MQLLVPCFLLFTALVSAVLTDDVFLQKRSISFLISSLCPAEVQNGKMNDFGKCLDSSYCSLMLYFPGEIAEPIDPKMKKPFCNAFTGCGKKRSDESMATLVDLNSEPAVEELSRQILSEAKLWEAIQEARMELLNRKQQQSDRIPLQPLPLTTIRKRSHYLYT